MLIVGENYIVNVPEKKKPTSGFMGPDDPRWKKVAPYKRSRRQIKGIPAMYMGKPLTPALRKKVEAEQAKREAARKRREKRSKKRGDQ
ncbi:MAG TPA: hypothetical protein VH253_07310 [Phycisphaerae bacterium]|nr:hypothetical protein [Phycisphaerae bacterium]